MDYNISFCLTWLTIAFVGLAIVFRTFRKRIFAAYCSNMSKGPRLRGEKKKLFQPMNEAAKKAGPGKLKVLEIGGGSGSNFSFVETPVNWTVTEPNLFFEPYFVSNCNDWKDKHDIGKLVEAFGEDLGQFETDSFDAVIVTLVLCSVSSVQDTLREIRRVLKPGGVFYFAEHVRAPAESPKRRKFHDFVSESGIWPTLFDGCRLNREIQREVDRAGFSRVEMVNCDFEMKPWFFFYMNPVKFALYGWATK